MRDSQTQSRRSSGVNVKRFLAERRSTPIWCQRARFSNARAARERKTEDRAARSVARKMSLGRENYQSSIIPTLSDRSGFRETQVGALIACVAVGLILTPVARRYQMPFAAIGFASVVSMMPGVFLFRMASGLVQLTNGSNATLELLGATMADGMIAVTIILAMSFGVVVPKVVIDRLGDGATQSRH